MTTATTDLQKVLTTYQDIEKRRDETKSKLAELKEKLTKEMQGGDWFLRANEITQLEDELSMLEKLLIDRQEQEQEIAQAQALVDFEKSQKILDSAMEKEAEILAKTDRLYNELDKCADELAALRQDAQERIPSTYLILAKELHRPFSKRLDKLGRIAYVIRKHHFENERARGRRQPWEAVPQKSR